MYKSANLEYPKESDESLEVLMERRRKFVEEQGFEEIVGCYECLHDDPAKYTTMPWRIVPLRKCEKHPSYWVKVALVKREKST